MSRTVRPTHSKEGYLIVTKPGTNFTLVNRDGKEISGTERGLLLYNGGTVCDDNFSDNSADSICREMGYPEASGWESKIVFSEEQFDREIKLYDVHCKYNELHLCTYSTSITYACDHTRDVILSCAGEFAYQFSCIPKFHSFPRDSFNIATCFLGLKDNFTTSLTG